MLVLSRYKDETIWIGEEIEVTIVSVNGGKVKIGINATKEVGVLRDEVKKRIAIEGRKSNGNQD